MVLMKEKGERLRYHRIQNKYHPPGGGFSSYEQPMPDEEILWQVLSLLLPTVQIPQGGHAALLTVNPPKL